MLSSISWGQYITALITLLLLYYSFIGFKYFRWEILSLIGIKRIDEERTAIQITDVKNHFVASNHADFLPKSNQENTLQAFSDEIKAFLFQASPAAPKEELLFAIRQIVSKYPTMENRNTINQLILEETEKQYQGLVAPEDLIVIWS